MPPSTHFVAGFKVTLLGICLAQVGQNAMRGGEVDQLGTVCTPARMMAERRISTRAPSDEAASPWPCLLPRIG